MSASPSSKVVVSWFDTHEQWEAYWYGPEMTVFKTVHSGWYQVPVLYTFADIVAAGSRASNGVDVLASS